MDKANRLTISLVLLRVMLGASMLIHGIGKASNLQGTLDFFGSMGVPTFMTYLVVAIEVLGGILMIVGVLVPLVALGFVAILGTAMVMLGLDRGFAGGYELELILLVLSIAVGLSHFDKKILTILPDVK